MIIALMTFLASLGFGIIFDLKGLKLLVAALNGMLGGIIYNLLLTSQGEMMALFVASFSILAFAAIMARILRCPTTILLISALVPLVPGGLMYETVLALIDNDMMLALSFALRTIYDVIAIVIGIVFASGLELLISRLYKKIMIR